MWGNSPCSKLASLSPFDRNLNHLGTAERTQYERQLTLNLEAPRDEVYRGWPNFNREPTCRRHGEANRRHLRLVLGMVVAFAVVLGLVASTIVGGPRDLDGRYANSPLKQWFDQLASGKGLCCSSEGAKP
jgi:hypothetical protein